MIKETKKKNNYLVAALVGALSAVLVLALIFLGVRGMKNAGNGSETEQAVQTETQSETQMSETESETPTETETQTELQTAALTELPTEPETLPVTEAPETEGTNGHLVAIDPGHQSPQADMNGTEPVGPESSEMKLRIVSGTYGRTSGVDEYELNLEVSLLLKAELEARGYQVIMTREVNDIDLCNIDRAEIANNAGADIMVRIHANGSDNSGAAGALTMIPSASNPYVGGMYDSCYSLASCIINSYCAATGLANDGIMETDSMTGINWCQMPVTIVEMGFMTNQGDDLYMTDPANQPVMAAGIADGIDAYFER